MNIKITHNWLLDYLETDATPYEIQKYLSLCGPSIEKVEKVGDDFVYDIEITSNRVDSASVFGIALEACAILPEFGKKASIKINLQKQYLFKNLKEKDNKTLEIEIKEKNLISRISAIVLSNIEIKKSSTVIERRLAACGIGLINNVVDISNYIRISSGQPCHIFDYDSIGGKKMILRKSKKDEKIQTLDKDNISLPGDDIVISDGLGKLIDQPGIMGAYNSSVKQNTKNIVLFVPVFNGQMVRRTSMITGKRSDSATYFEKGIDPEKTESTLVYGTNLLIEQAGAEISSKIIDIYESKNNPKKIIVSQNDINSLIGINIDPSKSKTILNNLGFIVESKDNNLIIDVPSYRYNDINSKQDIVEEIARVYGYSKIPSKLQSMEFIIPQNNTEKITHQIQNIKLHLKHIGLNEVINLSMISEKEIKNINTNISNFLKLKNPISKDLEYLRTDLLSSLLLNIKSNQGKSKDTKLFEIANVYIDKKSDFPDEDLVIGIISTSSFFDLKGIIEAVLKNLNISLFSFAKSKNNYFVESKQAELIINKKRVGYFGAVKSDILRNFEISNQIYFAQIDFLELINNSKNFPEYKKPYIYSVIKLDLTLPISNYAEFKNKSFATSKLLINMYIVDRYMNNLSVRFLFSSPSSNITEKEALIELEKIKKEASINQ